MVKLLNRHGDRKMWGREIKVWVSSEPLFWSLMWRHCEQGQLGGVEIARSQGSHSALQEGSALGQCVYMWVCLCICVCVCRREQTWKEKKAIDKPRGLLEWGSADGNRQVKFGLEAGWGRSLAAFYRDQDSGKRWSGMPSQPILWTHLTVQFWRNVISRWLLKTNTNTILILAEWLWEPTLPHFDSIIPQNSTVNYFCTSFIPKF